MLDAGCWMLDAGYWIRDGTNLFPLRRQANPRQLAVRLPTGVIRKEPVPQLREG